MALTGVGISPVVVRRQKLQHVLQLRTHQVAHIAAIALVGVERFGHGGIVEQEIVVVLRKAGRAL